MTFGEYMREKGFTAKSLAEKSGRSIRSVERYTTGRLPLSNSRAWFIAAIAKALDTTVEYLLSLDG